MKAFHDQLRGNPVYAAFVNHLGVKEPSVTTLDGIPFLPVELFKQHRVYASPALPAITFQSSGTTDMIRSSHHVADITLYHSSLLSAFHRFYGDPSHFSILALAPSPREAPASSLSYMINVLIRSGSGAGSGFYFHDHDHLKTTLQQLSRDALPDQSAGENQKSQPRVLLMGLTYALLDFAEKFPIPLPEAIIMETGGMKGQRREMIREEVHGLLKTAFSAPSIHSEYGMTELLSQAYSKGENRFYAPPWMKILIRDPHDPLGWVEPGRTGGINVIDLANRYSCPFIATQDLGKYQPDGSFAVLGRFDTSELRGCNLLVS